MIEVYCTHPVKGEILVAVIPDKYLLKLEPRDIPMSWHVRPGCWCCVLRKNEQNIALFEVAQPIELPIGCVSED